MTSSEDPCLDIRNCRQLSDIITSSLATIFACIWAANHRDIPDPSDRWYRAIAVPIWSAVRSLMMPEVMLARAILQFVSAGEIARELEQISRKLKAEVEQEVDDFERITGTTVNVDGALTRVLWAGLAHGGMQRSEGVEASLMRATGWIRMRYTEISEKKRRGPKWTRTHGFFVLMGGFHLYDGDEPLRRLSREDVVNLAERDLLDPPTEDEIKDKSKGDWFSKGIALLQTLWFAMQCIARRVQNLPIAELELVTLAYTVIAVSCYCFWWKKPFGVGRPVRVFQAPDNPPAVAKSTFQNAVHALGFRDNGRGYHWPTLAANSFALLAAMIFGAIHCLAWSWSLPLMNIWRISSVIVVAIPGLALLSMLPGVFLHLSNRSHLVMPLVVYPLAVTSNFIITTYVIARILLMILALTTLKFLPPLAYQDIDWVTFIPHI